MKEISAASELAERIHSLILCREELENVDLDIAEGSIADIIDIWLKSDTKLTCPSCRSGNIRKPNLVSKVSEEVVQAVLNEISLLGKQYYNNCGHKVQTILNKYYIEPLLKRLEELEATSAVDYSRQDEIIDKIKSILESK